MARPVTRAASQHSHQPRVRAQETSATLTLGELLDQHPWVQRFGPFLALAGMLVLAVVIPARGTGGADLDLAGPRGGTPEHTTFPRPPQDGPEPLVGSDSRAPDLPSTPPRPAVDRPAGPAPGPALASAPRSGRGTEEPALPQRDEPDEPLRISETAYASRAGATGLTEPEFGQIRITAIVGQDIERGYLRLAGQRDILALRVDESGTSMASQAVLEICPVTTRGWTPGSYRFDEAPAYDADACVPGTPDDAFTLWRFPLDTFDAPDRPDGFVIVPGAGTGTWQVTFAGTADQ